MSYPVFQAHQLNYARTKPVEIFMLLPSVLNLQFWNNSVSSLCWVTKIASKGQVCKHRRYSWRRKDAKKQAEGHSEQALCIDMPLSVSMENDHLTPCRHWEHSQTWFNLKNMFSAHMKINPEYFLSLFTYLSRCYLQLLLLHW